MKRKIILFIIGILAIACDPLDLNPLSEGSSENWYSNESEVEMAVVKLFNAYFWGGGTYTYLVTNNINTTSHLWTDIFTDNYTNRQGTSGVTSATTTSETNYVVVTWQLAYSCIAAANRVLVNINKAASEVPEVKLKKFEANARFARASQYAKLIFHYGDVPFYTKILDIDEAFSLSRTSKDAILDSIYVDYDYAAQNLPLSYGSNSYQMATKGAALAMKARIALYMGDYAVARDAAEACMDLGVYQLYPDFRELFLSKTKNSIETVFATPLSVELGTQLPYPKVALPRIVGGFSNGGPSWDLFARFLCTDGLPIDESPLFDPHKPFKNRDPRCTQTIVEFGTEWLGYRYEPHPDSLKCFNYSTGTYVANKDNRAIDQYASYNALCLKKKVDEDWIDLKTDPDNMVIRFADVLLIYAEAKIELGQIDQSVLDVLNKVRARAYGVDYTQTSLYPAITVTDQARLRQILRRERDMEFPWEGSRYYDLIRWRLAEKALNLTSYGTLDIAPLRSDVVNKGLWFWGETPQIDEDGIADFSSLYNKGLCKILVQRKFETRQYLWPIPSIEIKINPNLEQNPGY
jgi:hypothetical protein